MKQCPKKCEMCGAPIVDIGAIVCVDGVLDTSHQVWTCHKKSCDEKAVLQVDRGHPRYQGHPVLGPDVNHPLRGEIVVHVQQIRRVDVKLESVHRRVLMPGDLP
jgi:hypothetical protein